MSEFNIKDYFGTQKVLDKGHVELCDGMVCDPRLKIVNAARVSFHKEVKELSEKDIKLITFLHNHEHYSTFRHSYFSFRVKAPLIVFRQWWKHQIGCDWNENENVGSIQMPETNWNEMCLSGDSVFSIRDDKGRKDTRGLRGTFQRYKNDPTYINHLNIVVCDEKTGQLITSKIKDVFDRGIQDTYEITLEDGKSITCTKSHRILTKDGWKTVEESLNPQIMNNGSVSFNNNIYFATNGVKYVGNGSYQDFNWLKKRKDNNKSIKEMAKEAGCSYHTIKKWLKIHNLNFDKKHSYFKKGSIPWNVGLTYNNPNFKMAEEHLQSVKEARSGSNSNFWKGGVSSDRRLITAWNQKISKTLFSDYDYICQKCGIRGGELQVHHVIPVWYDDSMAYDLNNVVPLCINCHINIHKNKEELLFAENLTKITFDKSIPRRKEVKIKIKYTKVKSIEYKGKNDCYDLEIYGENKNFICNGIVVHNSGRYVEFQPEFYIPNEIRIQSKDNKQGSNGKLETLSNGDDPVKYFEDSCNLMYDRYSILVKSGAAKEQARMLLPQNIYSECMWTCSLQCILYFLHQRLKSDAQFEIREYATAVASLILPIIKPLEINMK